MVGDTEPVGAADDGEKFVTEISGVPSAAKRRNGKTLSSLASPSIQEKPAGSVSRSHSAGVAA